MNLKRAGQLFFLIAFILTVDFITKDYVHSSIPLMHWSSPFYPYGGIPVFENWHGISFSINHVINKGAAWGMFATFQQVLLYLRMAVIGGLLTYLIFFPLSTARQIFFSLIVAGAIGNVLDYFVYGHVIDMFHFTFWGYTYPIFNVADSAICVGIFFILLQGMLQKFKNFKTA